MDLSLRHLQFSVLCVLRHFTFLCCVYYVIFTFLCCVYYVIFGFLCCVYYVIFTFLCCVYYVIFTFLCCVYYVIFGFLCCVLKTIVCLFDFWRPLYILLFFLDLYLLIPSLVSSKLFFHRNLSNNTTENIPNVILYFQLNSSTNSKIRN